MLQLWTGYHCNRTKVLQLPETKTKLIHVHTILVLAGRVPMVYQLSKKYIPEPWTISHTPTEGNRILKIVNNGS